MNNNKELEILENNDIKDCFHNHIKDIISSNGVIFRLNFPEKYEDNSDILYISQSLNTLANIHFKITDSNSFESLEIAVKSSHAQFFYNFVNKIIELDYDDTIICYYLNRFIVHEKKLICYIENNKKIISGFIFKLSSKYKLVIKNLITSKIPENEIKKTVFIYSTHLTLS